MDIFITRGALSGQLRLLPESVEAASQDELIVSEAPGRYRNVVRDVGIDKRGCSGRKVNWVDFNRDGLLDLFIDCQDRGNAFVQGKFPKQLWRQNPDKHFVDVAAEVGLDIPDHEVIDFVWFDADNDGYIDLLTSEDKGKSFKYEDIHPWSVNTCPMSSESLAEAPGGNGCESIAATEGTSGRFEHHSTCRSAGRTHGASLGTRHSRVRRR